MVRLVSWRDVDSGALQIIVDDTAEYRSRLRHGHECLAHQILRADGLKRSETVVTRHDHYQGLLDERTERQVWRLFFLSKKGRIDFSFRKAVRKQRALLTRDHHIDVSQFVS